MNIQQTASTPKLVTMIPADPQMTERDIRNKHLRIAPYCRVSTDKKEQLSSYEAQIEYYTEKINANPDWTLVRLYADEGITGILHLMRGQIFTFGGLTWFTMGGASSHDIQDGVLDPEAPDFEQKYWLLRRMRGMFRVKGRSWWAEEMPNAREYVEALKNLEQVNWKVDCILSHCGPSSVVRKIDPSYGSDQLTDFLETVNQRCQFTYWFFGHYHDNRIINDRYILQWEQISGLEI